jgi:hypothetical protein
MKLITYTFCLLVALSFTTCLIKPPEPEPVPWARLEGYNNNTNVRVLHTTANELYILSDDEFTRLNQNNEFVEKRNIGLPFDFTGRPGISDHSFYQITLNDSSKIEINFRLTKNASQLLKIKIDNFKESGDAAFLSEGEGKNTAAYNIDGTQFIIPVIQIPDSYYAFFLFNINLNPSKTEFEEIELVSRINITDFPANTGNLNTVRYIDGFFYATSLHGAIRINPSTGTYQKIFTDWMIDIFKLEDKIYATGFGNTLFVSEDNGQNFVPLDLGEAPPQMHVIDILQNKIFSQQAIGFPFNLVDANFTTSKRITLNEDFPQDFSAYQDIAYFNDNFYLSIFEKLYFGPEIITE